MFKEKLFSEFPELVEWFRDNEKQIICLHTKDISFYMLFDNIKQVDILRLLYIILNNEFEVWEKITSFVIALITRIEKFADFRKISLLTNYKYIENNINRSF